MATPRKRRSRGTGSIIKKASGNYAFQYRNARGQRITKSLKTKSRKEAETQAKELERALTARDSQDALHEIARARELIDTRALPISEVWAAFLDTSPTASAGTLKLYRRSLMDFQEWLAENRPSQSDFSLVSQEDADDWLSTVWNRGVSASTYNDRRGALSLIHKQLARPYRLGSNPWTKTARKKGVQQKRLPLTRDQIKKVLELELDEETRALIYLGLFAGMRLGDAVSLQVEDISEGVITYTPAKTAATSGAVARVPILPVLSQAIAPILKNRSKGPLLPETEKLYLRSRDAVIQKVLRIIHSITGRGEQNHVAQALRSRSLYGFHSLRHTFATEAARAGVSASMLQLMTGDGMQTLQKFYVQIGELSTTPASGFDKLPALLAPEGRQNSKREELKQLAEGLPLQLVDDLIKIAKAKTKGINEG